VEPALSGVILRQPGVGEKDFEQGKKGRLLEKKKAILIVILTVRREPKIMLKGKEKECHDKKLINGGKG